MCKQCCSCCSLVTHLLDSPINLLNLPSNSWETSFHPRSSSMVLLVPFLKKINFRLVVFLLPTNNTFCKGKLAWYYCPFSRFFFGLLWEMNLHILAIKSKRDKCPPQLFSSVSGPLHVRHLISIMIITYFAIVHSVRRVKNNFVNWFPSGVFPNFKTICRHKALEPYSSLNVLSSSLIPCTLWSSDLQTIKLRLRH